MNVEMMNLNLSQIADFCNGELSDTSNINQIITNVVIDSRNVISGSLFVAIIGDNTDGHKYIDESFKRGAVACIVSRTLGIALPNLILVDDTTKALGLLASKFRQHFSLPIVGITGSNGKTTVKNMLRCICNEYFGEEYVLATEGNLNNHWGMPLTLLKLDKKIKVLILEMGMNHFGEITYLTDIAKPTLVLVNNVLWAHAGHFSGLEDIAKAKGEIYTQLDNGATACINADSKFAEMWEQSIKNPQVKIDYYGNKNTHCYINNSNDVLEIVTAKGIIRTQLQLLGKHNHFNALSATVLALNLGCDLASISKGLASYTGYKGRLEKKTAFNGALIIDDSYNANPDSVKAAILAIKNLPKPHWFVLGDLGELGEFAKNSHQDVGVFAKNNGIDKLLTIGELTSFAGKTFIDNTNDDVSNWVHFANKVKIIEYCKANLPQHGTLLIKGSNSLAMWEIANNLM